MNLFKQQSMIATTLVNMVVWALLYYLFLRSPWPAGWNLHYAPALGLLVGATGGALSGVTSRHILPGCAGAAIGIAFGSTEAYVTDLTISAWQRAWWSLTDFGFYPLWLWLAITAGWVVVDFFIRTWRPKGSDAVPRA